MRIGNSVAISRTIDARLVAERPGLSSEVFRREMKRGAVECRQSEDADRVRLILRYRARSWPIVLEEIVS
ncbi:MAG: DUF6522 family protein [Alphaproteobacteria bacterium]